MRPLKPSSWLVITGDSVLNDEMIHIPKETIGSHQVKDALSRVERPVFGPATGAAAASV